MKDLTDPVKGIRQAGEDLNQKLLASHIKGSVHFFQFASVSQAVREIVEMGRSGNHYGIEFKFFLENIFHVEVASWSISQYPFSSRRWFSTWPNPFNELIINV